MSNESRDMTENQRLDASLCDVRVKKERGRYRKLTRRASEAKEGCETSGISCPSDWNELLRMDKSPAVKPELRLRRLKDKCQNTEGADHRAILHYILMRNFTSLNHGNGEGSLPNIPSWATIHNSAAVESVAVIEIHLKVSTKTTWEEILERFHCFSDKGLHLACRWFQGEIPKSISDVLMYSTPVSKNEYQKRKKLRCEDGCVNVSLIDLLKPLFLKQEELRKEGYPIFDSKSDTTASPSNEVGDITQKLPTLEQAKAIVREYHAPVIPQQDHTQELRFVKTSHKSQPNERRIFGLDCEMVKTTAGVELARVTLIQVESSWDDKKISHRVILDELVKPQNAILDYLTIYSGITEDLICAVETRIEQVQAFLVKSINSDDIIIGHSLENDFRAVRLIHDVVIDTSVIFRGYKGRKYALKHLTASLLKRTIQDARHGHCSEQDALASLELAIQRARQGPSFRLLEMQDSRENLLEKIPHENDHPVVCIGPSVWLRDHVTCLSTAAHALICERFSDNNRKALISWLSSSKRRAKMVWSKFPVNFDNNDLDLVNQTFEELFERALPRTLIQVAFQIDVEQAKEFSTVRKTRKNPRASLPWTIEDEASCSESTTRAQSGHIIWMST